MLYQVQAIELHPRSEFYHPAIELVEEVLFDGNKDKKTIPQLFINPEFDGLGVVDQGQLIGLGVYCLEYPTSILEFLGVTQTKRKEGIGGGILTECEQTVMRLGSRAMRLLIRPTAREFYTRRGYEQSKDSTIHYEKQLTAVIDNRGHYL